MKTLADRLAYGLEEGVIFVSESLEKKGFVRNDRNIGLLERPKGKLTVRGLAGGHGTGKHGHGKAKAF